MSNGIYFGGLLVLQLVLVSSCGDWHTVWYTSFANGPVVPYLTTVTGIAFWLRIAKTLVLLVRERGGQEAFRWVYMAAGIGVPLLIQRCVSETGQYICRKRRDGGD